MKRGKILYHYIYVTTNKINGHNYVGQKTCYETETPETDGYLGSGDILNDYAIPKYGRENFYKEILAICYSKKISDILEKQYIKLYKEIGKAEYNISSGGNGGNLGDDVNQKISQTIKALYASEKGIEIRKKISEARKKQVFSEETLAKRKESIHEYWNSERGQKQKEINSQIQKNNENAWTKGKHWYNNGTIQVCTKECPEGFVPGQLFIHKHTEESKKKASETLLNMSPERRKQWSERLSAARTGKHISYSCKANISKANKGRRYFNNGEIEVMRFECPPGFVPGRCPKAKAAISKGQTKS